MNWDAIGAIGEVVGAAAVVVSLIYVSIQLRAGTRALQTTTRDSVTKSLLEWNYVVMDDPQLAWINQAGALDFESLEPKDRARYMHTISTFLQNYENLYLHFLEGAVTKEFWEARLPMLATYIVQPGARNYWEKRRSSFDLRFNAVIEAVEPEAMEFGHTMSGIQPPASINGERGGEDCS